MKELKRFFFSKKMYSIMNSNRQKNIVRIMMQLFNCFSFPHPPSRLVTYPITMHRKANTRYSFMLLPCKYNINHLIWTIHFPD